MSWRAIRFMHASVERQIDAVAPLREQVRQCHTELDESAARWLQKPASGPVRLYLHALCIEDITIQSVLCDHAPLFASLWPPVGDPVDAALLSRYATAVYASTDAYLAELPFDGLNRVVDLEKVGLGRRTAGWVIGQLVVQELERICSEVAGGVAHSY